MCRSISITSISTALIAILFFLSSCAGDKKEEEKANKDDMGKEKSEKGDSNKEEKKTQKKSPVLPNTLQVASSFKKAGLPYKEGIILSPDQVEGLVNPERKKLAFGAYSADLAYLVINKKEDEALKVMSSLMKLAEELQISSVFNTEKIAERFRSNLDNRDSLVKLIVEVQQRFDTYVAKNRDRRLRTIAYAGGWSEAMYLAANAKEGDMKDLHLEVEEQMTVLEKLLKALKRDVQNAKGPLADLVEELKKMHRVYKQKAPKPGQKLPADLMKQLKNGAENARAIISNHSKAN